MEAAANQARHSLLIQALIVHVCLEVHILILDLLVFILQKLSLLFVSICLHLYFVSVLFVQMLPLPLHLVLLVPDYLLTLLNFCV